MNTQTQETPIQEAVSLITIVAILLSVGAYLAAAANVPVASPALLWLSQVIYHWCPALTSLQGSQMPFLIASAAVGGVLWLLGVSLAPLIARGLSAGHLSSLERQTQKLRSNRARIVRRRRDRDSFDVS